MLFTLIVFIISPKIWTFQLLSLRFIVPSSVKCVLQHFIRCIDFIKTYLVTSILFQIKTSISDAFLTILGITLLRDTLCFFLAVSFFFVSDAFETLLILIWEPHTGHYLEVGYGRYHYSSHN